MAHPVALTGVSLRSKRSTNPTQHRPAPRRAVAFQAFVEARSTRRSGQRSRGVEVAVPLLCPAHSTEPANLAARTARRRPPPLAFRARGSMMSDARGRESNSKSRASNGVRVRLSPRAWSAAASCARVVLDQLEAHLDAYLSRTRLAP